MPMDLEVKCENGLKLSGSYFLPFSIAASTSFVWKTLPILPKYFRLYSLSNEGDVLIASGLYFLHFSIAASITLVWKKNKTINELIAKVS
jgi:hypothetical protein